MNSWFSARITNESIKNLLILLLVAFLSGTFIAALPLYFLWQHEPKDLFSTGDMMTADYAPLWIALSAVQFGPFVITLVNRKFRRFRKYALAVLLTPFVMAAVPRLDPTYYSSYYTRCARLSEPEVDELARAWIAKETDSVVSLLGSFSRLGDTTADVQNAELVQMVDWRPLEYASFSATYRTARGALFEINIGPECATEVSLTDRVVQPLGRVIYQKQ